MAQRDSALHPLVRRSGQTRTDHDRASVSVTLRSSPASRVSVNVRRPVFGDWTDWTSLSLSFLRGILVFSGSDGVTRHAHKGLLAPVITGSPGLRSDQGKMGTFATFMLASVTHRKMHVSIRLISPPA